MRYKVRIKTPNKMFVINGKPIRSPFEAFLSEKDTTLIKSRIKFYGLTQSDYEIALSGENLVDYSRIDPVKSTKIKIPEEIKESIVKEKKVLHKPIIKNIPPDSKLSNEPNNIEEQIIKKHDENTEIKIEELSTKSSSILESFLKNEL